MKLFGCASPSAASAESPSGAPTPAKPAAPVVLGYWAIRGLIAPCRNLCSFLGVPFTEESYVQGPAPDFDRSSWLSKKATMADALDFPNLPYMIDGEVKLTQSQTILRYLARTYGAGSGVYEGSPAFLAHVDLVMDQTIDLRQAVTRAAYGFGGGNFPDLVSKVLPDMLPGFERLLSKHTFAAGDAITIADFALWEVLDQVRVMVAERSEEPGVNAFAAYPAIARYMGAFEAEPRIAAILSAPGYMARPYNNVIAQWK